MRADAASAGVVEIAGRSYPLVQILTIKDILKGKRPSLPFPDTPDIYVKAGEVTEGVQGPMPV